MAQITITKMHDGPRNAVFHVSVFGDGSGELVDEVIIDPATSFDKPLPPEPAMRVEKLWYDLSGFDAFLEFDYLTSDTPVWTMSQNNTGQPDFSEIGGLTDRSNPLDGTGKLMLTTSGLGDGDFGTIIVYAKKS
jgi:hypothetical protein